MLRIPLRLGEDSFSDGRISAEKQKQLMRTIRAFRLLMKVFNVVSYRACATSAMRDAVNGGRIADRIYAKTGIRIEVIDGVEEARIVYDSHIGDLLESQGSYIYVDVGGGSTEVSLIHDGALISSRSYDVGTVRMLSGKVKERTWEMLRDDMDQLKNEYPGIQIIGSGGNINKLYSLAGKRDNARLAVSELRRWYDLLRPLDPEQRMERFKLNPDRADVIVPAAEIFLTIADRIGADSIFVPTIGIIDGLIHTLCSNYLKTH